MNNTKSILKMSEIQDISFNILKTVKIICEKEHLNYVLAFGTLIGAVRHKDYIPWDDDVDIMMPRPDFEKLISYFDSHKEELWPFTYINRSKVKNYPYELTRVIDTRYVLDVDNEHPYGLGVFVDIYVMDAAGNSIKEAQNLLRKTKILPSSIFLSTRIHLDNHNTKGYLKKFIKPLFYVFVKAIGRDTFSKILHKIILKKKYNEFSHIACIEWGNNIGSAMAKYDIENPAYLEFHGELFAVPNNYEYYLKQRYGDYMTLPPEKERVYHHMYKAYRKDDFA